MTALTGILIALTVVTAGYLGLEAPFAAPKHIRSCAPSTEQGYLLCVVTLTVSVREPRPRP